MLQWMEDVGLFDEYDYPSSSSGGSGGYGHGYHGYGGYGRYGGQELTLVHIFPQPEPFLSLKPAKQPNTGDKKCSR
jgi:hypothetical protein